MLTKLAVSDWGKEYLRCKYCMYYHHFVSKDLPEHGQCRKNPPRHKTKHSICGFARVDKDRDWCGEFIPNPKFKTLTNWTIQEN